MTAMMKTQTLSLAARNALIDVGASRQGAVIPTTTHSAVIGELIEHGLIGAGHGLTAQGVVARDRVMSEALDALFG